MKRKKTVIYALLLLGAVSSSSCSQEHYNIQTNAYVPSIKSSMRLTSMNDTIGISLIVSSMRDSIYLEKVEILSPSYVKWLSGYTLLHQVLQKGDSLVLKPSFVLEKRESFKLKAVIYGDYQTNGFPQKIGEVRYLFFLRDGTGFIVEDDPKRLVGRRKTDGSTIRDEDLRIFNQVESETSSTPAKK